MNLFQNEIIFTGIYSENVKLNDISQLKLAIKK